MDHVRCLSWWWDVGTHEPQALDQGRHHGGIPREPGHGLTETRLLRRLVEIQPGDSRFLTGGDRQAYDQWSYGSEAWPAWSSMISISCSTRDGVSSGTGAASRNSVRCQT